VLKNSFICFNYNEQINNNERCLEMNKEERRPTELLIFILKVVIATTPRIHKFTSAMVKFCLPSAKLENIMIFIIIHSSTYYLIFKLIK
jgi:hypothetical protein